MLNGYSFTNPSPMPGGERWYCSGRAKWNCSVCLHVNDDYELVCISNEHTHLPPVYDKTTDGLYIEKVPMHKSLLFIKKLFPDSKEVIEYYLDEEEEEDPADAPVFVESRAGTTLLQYKGYRYGKKYKTKRGTRWGCAINKNCSAFLILNRNDEITVANTRHEHGAAKRESHERIDENQDDAAVLITSRKGKEILLFRHYTYRRQYQKKNKSRWVCSNLKNCRASVFTDNNNYITSVYEKHCHPPPKYYTNPTNVIGALREPLITEEEGRLGDEFSQ
ncbi:hypothetical protein ABMA28_001389 [Loxostege sticticalis]|uniref:FLYWCH-type domain-containing protein n=1 Tax=Loxostege sticticalis TaxID=481309 RepID=A0ABD0T1I2_LOXSC